MKLLACATLALAIAVLGACEPPSPALRLRLTDGPAQMCPSTNCAEIDLACAAWISIRIVDPADPLAPYLSQCSPIPDNNMDNLCSLANVDLEAVPLPLRDLEVQVAVYPEAMVMIDPITGEGTCPANVQYDAVDGFPVASAATPALGGRTYYRPGDEEMIVTLGCTNLAAVNDGCGGGSTVAVAATIDDFDTRVSVSSATGDRLNVAVGEPIPMAATYVLNPVQIFELERTIGFPPAWSSEIDQLFTSHACLVVLDSAPQSTSLLTCRTANVTIDSLQLSGVWLSRASLDQILGALSLAQFPPQGLTIGIVLDFNGNPMPNQVVQATGASIQYLSADRSSLGGAVTSASGVWVSTDAPFGTSFSSTNGPLTTLPVLGGLVEGKVSLVILRFNEPVVGGD